MVKQWKGYEKGVNLGGWLSQCNYTVENYENFITRKDFEIIKSWGCDHVRVPVDYDLFGDKECNYREEGFKYIQRAIDWSRENGLNMVLDIHKAYGYSFYKYDAEDGFFDNEKYQNEFYRTWTELARRYSKYEDTVAFELLNEVTEQRFSDSWNRIAGKAIEAIRQISPTVKILVGGYWNNSADAMKDLVVPADDKNIILNFHCYSPFIFTHQGASWVNDMPRDFRYKYRHTYEEYNTDNAALFPYNPGAFKNMPDQKALIGVEYFRGQFTEALKCAEKYDLPLYCGEYGVIDLAEAEDTLEWYRDINTCFREYGIGRAAWSYREMNFGLEGEHYAPVFNELVKYL